MSTYYVATYGDDGNAGSIGSPWLTPNHAWDVASPGDLIYLRAGTYSSSSFSSSDTNVYSSGTSWANAITFQAYPSEAVHVVSMGVYSESYLIFQDLFFDGAPDGQGGETISIGGGASQGAGAHHVRFVNCDIHGNNTAGSHIYSAISISEGSGGSNEFIGGSIHDASWPSPQMRGVGVPHGIYVSAPNNIVDGVEIYHIGQYAIHSFFGTAPNAPTGNIYRNNYIHDTGPAIPGGDYTSSAIGVGTGHNGTHIYNNLIVRSANGISLYNATSDVLIAHNTIVSSTASYDQVYPAISVLNFGTPGTGNIVRNNIVFANQDNSIDTAAWTSPTVSNNLTTAPDFVDASSGDFHIQPSSDAIGAGVYLAGAVPLDFDGVTRSNPPDVGAFQFKAGGGGGGTGDVIPDGTAAVGNSGNALTSLTLSGKVTAGVNRVAVLSVAWSANSVPALSTVTYGGVSMTLAWAERDVAEWNAAAVYILVNPPTSACDVVIEWPATADYAVASVSSYENVLQADPIRDANGAHGAAPTASVTVTTAEGDLIVDAVAGFNSAFTVGANQTEVFQAESETGSAFFGAQSVQAGVDGGVLSWSQSSGTVYASAAVSLQPAAAPAAPQVPFQPWSQRGPQLVH